MGADNWALCPQCLSNAIRDQRVYEAALHSQYGKIPREEWLTRLGALGSVDKEDFYTLREDYEFYGVEEGIVTADYSASCAVCGLYTQFTYRHKFWSPPEALDV